MKRRTLLTSISTLTVGIAGCLTSSNTTSPTRSSPLTSGGNDTETPKTTTANGNQDTTGSSSENPEIVFTDTDCPSFSNAVDRTVCWPVTDTAWEKIYLDASTAIYNPDPRDVHIETVEFVLHNEHSGHQVKFNPDKWEIKRQNSDGWTTAAAGTSSDTTLTSSHD
ncbi:hypothetical protein ACFR9U_20175 [Halorientalis brevis]|uniref:Uncharacterized protein n=1 Tax=Halorientalis brevis TaxID=1126241 RepID=A0ABD6CG48_9EURY|nr:hypothetical protein [Halorientalis brevis]